MSITITVRQIDAVSLVDIAGQLKLKDGGSAAVRDAIRDLVSQSKKKIVLNMGKVTDADCSGIGELVSGWTTTTNAGGTLKLLAVTNEVEKQLAITKLFSIFEIFKTEADAIRSFDK